MGFVLTITAGLVLWVVSWALGTSGLDGFIYATAIITAGATVRVLAGYLPGRRS
jgi:hypothetical protein